MWNQLAMWFYYVQDSFENHTTHNSETKWSCTTKYRSKIGVKDQQQVTRKFFLVWFLIFFRHNEDKNNTKIGRSNIEIYKMKMYETDSLILCYVPHIQITPNGPRSCVTKYCYWIKCQLIADAVQKLEGWVTRKFFLVLFKMITTTYERQIKNPI